ncbi:MAG: TetR/AcrR family transcriptional regulator [Burkholderiaceae bacterium]
MHPPKQARGHARERDLIDAGLRLLQDRALDEITIEQVARTAGCSVGNLYKRFAGKEAFLSVLVDAVRARLIGEIDGLADALPGQHARLDRAVQQVVRFELDVFTRYRGLMRGLTLHRLQHGALAGAGLRDVRARFQARAVEALLPLVTADLSPPVARERLEFGLQVSLSSLIEKTLLDAVPRGDDGDAFVTRMSAMMVAHLRAPMVD